MQNQQQIKPPKPETRSREYVFMIGKCGHDYTFVTTYNMDSPSNMAGAELKLQRVRMQFRPTHAMVLRAGRFVSNWNLASKAIVMSVFKHHPFQPTVY